MITDQKLYACKQDVRKMGKKNKKNNIQNQKIVNKINFLILIYNPLTSLLYIFAGSWKKHQTKYKNIY